jgi:hypothetical protein
LQDSVAAASAADDVEEAYDDGDDSDMYMEPDGAETSQAGGDVGPDAGRTEAPMSRRAKSRGHQEAEEEQQEQEQQQQQQQQHHRRRDEDEEDAEDEERGVVEGSRRVKLPRATIIAVRPVQTSIQVTSSESAEPSGGKEESKPETEERSLETDSQNFFPSFAELFGNHRLPYTEHQQQQQRYRPSRFLGYFQRDRPFAIAASASNKDSQPALLGSGNFGVIRGGTYYPESKENDEYSIDESAYSPFYHGRRRRGREREQGSLQLLQEPEAPARPRRGLLRQLPGLCRHNGPAQVQLLAPLGRLRQQERQQREPRPRAAQEHHRDAADARGGGGAERRGGGGDGRRDDDDDRGAAEEAQPGQEETHQDQEVPGGQGQEVTHDPRAPARAQLNHDLRSVWRVTRLNIYIYIYIYFFNKKMRRAADERLTSG